MWSDNEVLLTRQLRKGNLWPTSHNTGCTIEGVNVKSGCFTHWFVFKQVWSFTTWKLEDCRPKTGFIDVHWWAAPQPGQLQYVWRLRGFAIGMAEKCNNMSGFNASWGQKNCDWLLVFSRHEEKLKKDSHLKLQTSNYVNYVRTTWSGHI